MRRRTDKINAVFHTSPRTSDDRDGVWLERNAEQRDLEDLLRSGTNHVCVDGPSGTGKTSLTWTALEELRAPYIYVPIGQYTKWSDLCRALLRKPSDPELSIGGDVEFGVKNLMPELKFRVSFGQKERQIDGISYEAAAATLWNEDDVSYQMATTGVSLVVDDFERASPELSIRLADLAKHLTTMPGRNARLVVVGANDSYIRLMNANKALRARVDQLSIGSVSDPEKPWFFLRKSFEKIGVKHPANSKFEQQRRHVPRLKRKVFLAADGLLKSINALGLRISRHATRVAISAASIDKACTQQMEQNWEDCQNDFPGLVEKVSTSKPALEVFRHMYVNGIGKVYRSRDVVGALMPFFSMDSIEKAIDDLVDLRFAVRTGPSGNIVFINEPDAAHALGVALSQPERFPTVQAILERARQLLLPFPEYVDEHPGQLEE